MPQYQDFGFQPRSRLEAVGQQTHEKQANGFEGKDGVLGTHRSPSPFSSPLAAAMVVATVCTPSRVVSWPLGSFENEEPHPPKEKPHLGGARFWTCVGIDWDGLGDRGDRGDRKIRGPSSY